MKTTCKAFKGGPLEVSGDFEIIDRNGNKLDSSGTVFFCRCGGSSNKPFCDGTHNTNGHDK